MAILPACGRVAGAGKGRSVPLDRAANLRQRRIRARARGDRAGSTDSSGYITLEPLERFAGRQRPRQPRSGDRRRTSAGFRGRADRRPGNRHRLASRTMRSRAIESRLLVFTNSKRVWRTNSRGDYWVLDRAARELRKLGGDAPPASLMHAKFVPERLAGGLCARKQHLRRRPGRRPDHQADPFALGRRNQRHIRLGL